MKKLISSVMTGAIILGLMFSVNASTQSTIVKLDGKVINFSQSVDPYINDDGRTMVHVRFFEKNMGCNIQWEEANQTIIITNERNKITLKIGEGNILHHNKYGDFIINSDTKIVLQGEKTMVPLRFIALCLEAGVAWDEKNNTVFIKSDPGIITPDERKEIQK